MQSSGKGYFNRRDIFRKSARGFHIKKEFNSLADVT
jgi:hypothetical protein